MPITNVVQGVFGKKEMIKCGKSEGRKGNHTLNHTPEDCFSSVEWSKCGLCLVRSSG